MLHKLIMSNGNTRNIVCGNSSGVKHDVNYTILICDSKSCKICIKNDDALLTSFGCHESDEKVHIQMHKSNYESCAMHFFENE